MITTVTPAGPMFFCAPANTSPNGVMSKGRESMSEDMSLISILSDFGNSLNWVP